MTQLLNKNKLVAIILCFTMLFSITSGIFTEAFAADEEIVEENVYDVTDGGALMLPHNQKITLFVDRTGWCQWQILVDDTLWVNIQNANSNTLELSYAMVESAFTDRGTGQLRCKYGEDMYTEVVDVMVDFNVEDSVVSEEAMMLLEDEEQKPEVEDTPVVEEQKPEVEDTPVVEEQQPEVEDIPVVEEQQPEVEDTPVVEEQQPEVEDTPVVEEQQPEVEDTPVVEEQKSEVEDTPVVDEVADQQFSLKNMLTAVLDKLQPQTAENTVTESTEEENNTSDNGGVFSLMKTPDTYSSIQLSAADDDIVLEDPKTITVNYVFKNGQTAAPNWSASIEAGTPFKQTLTCPTVTGYKPSVTENLPTGIDFSTFGNSGTHADTGYVEIDLASVTEPVTVNIVYQPALVNYTVYYHFQNVEGDDDDDYELVKTVPLSGLTESPVEEAVVKDANNMPDTTGFKILGYERPVIAADGSTEVHVKFDRIYYLMNFELGEDAYGTEPIYARYDASVEGLVNNPVRPGYTFLGWSLNGKDVVDLPSTMPAGNVTYKAVWSEGKDVDYTIVYWQENPNDDNYSYWGSETETAKAGSKVSGSDTIPETIHAGEKPYFTYNDDETQKNVIVAGDGSTIVNVYYDRKVYTLTFYARELTCGKEAHAHDSNCLNCGKTEHQHNNDCCSKDGKHRYHECNTEDCAYGYEHSHSSSCYVCGKTEHDHSNGCYGYNKTVKTITAKYQQDIRSFFPIVGTNGAKYVGYWWQVPSDGAPFFDPGTYVVSIDTMPGESLTFNGTYQGIDAKIYYYVESLNGTAGTKIYDSKQFNLFKTVITVQSGSLTYLEEFHDINGFTQWKSDPAFTSHDANGRASVKAENFLYYTRNSYQLKFYNYNDYLTDKEKTVQYQAGISAHEVVKQNVPYPANMEKGAYEFEGWYTTENCVEGTKVNFATMTMPASDLTLYAKWVPVNHTVTFYKTEDDITGNNPMDDPHDPITVQHRKTVRETVENKIAAETEESVATSQLAKPTNNGLDFVGWFYKETVDGKTVEKALDLDNMPITKDLYVYAKWSSNKLVGYTIKYVYVDENGNKVEIAPQTVGEALALQPKTFDAKGGEELYLDYQDGYFPTVESHTIEQMSLKAEENVYEFVYVKRAAVPYTVQYLEKGTNEVLATQKEVLDNTKAVVTEQFVSISGYMPDAYQKRLVVIPDEENVLIFYYTEDNEHAPYQITHYIQNLDGETYTEYKSLQATGDIDKWYPGPTEKDTVASLVIEGFTFDSTVKDTNYGDTLLNGQLTKDGLHLKLFYKRNKYPYTVKYLDTITGNPIAEEKTGEAFYKESVSEYADSVITKDKVNYKRISGSPQQITIDTKNNEIVFHYMQEVTINYKVVPDGSGTLNEKSATAETLTILDSTAKGATPTAKEGYRFVGWFTDENCNNPVTVADGTLDAETNHFTPAKTKEYTRDGEKELGYETKTYYAKFERALVDLTIKKTVNKTFSDYSDKIKFVFSIVGAADDANTKHINMKVAVAADDSVIIKDLPAGKYTVTEVNSGWRYDADASKTETIMDDKELTFANSAKPDKWLSWAVAVENFFETIAGGGQ